jgi:hypothetical protein
MSATRGTIKIATRGYFFIFFFFFNFEVFSFKKKLKIKNCRGGWATWGQGPWGWFRPPPKLALEPPLGQNRGGQPPLYGPKFFYFFKKASK